VGPAFHRDTIFCGNSGAELLPAVERLAVRESKITAYQPYTHDRPAGFYFSRGRIDSYVHDLGPSAETVSGRFGRIIGRRGVAGVDLADPALSPAEDGPGSYATVNIILACCLVAGTVLPFGVNWLSNRRTCSTNFLTYYEEAGKTLASLIPPGSQLYWRGSGRHLAFMLYVDQVKIFPPQIHAGAGYAAGETERLYRLGLYNEELDEQWRESADILIVWDTYFTDEVREFFEQPGYEQISYDMGNLAQCEDALYVFRKTR
jgi:hypothetical protein